MSIDQEVSFQSAFSTHTPTWRLRCQCSGRELNTLQKVSVCAKLFTRLTEQTGGMEQNDKHNLCCFPVGFSFRACPVTGEIDFLGETDRLSCTSVSCGFCGSHWPWLCPLLITSFLDWPTVGYIDPWHSLETLRGWGQGVWFHVEWPGLSQKWGFVKETESRWQHSQGAESTGWARLSTVAP